MTAKYQITINHDQLLTLIEATELYARIGTGQLEYIQEVIRLGILAQNPEPTPERNLALEELYFALQEAKKPLFNTTYHWGIRDAQTWPMSKIAHDLEQVLKQAYCATDPNNGPVAWRDVFVARPDVPLATFEVSKPVPNSSEEELNAKDQL